MARTYGEPLSTHELPLLFRRVYRALDERRGQIDALNVFPVPDADTGTNMVLTIKAGLDALRDARRQQLRDEDELAQIVIRGVIRGARGNSGVILSQVLRAVVEETTRTHRVDAAAYARALRAAAELAYAAVVEPVSGTMLTVIAAAAEAAEQAVQTGASLTGVSRDACTATREAVERTPTQLAVLADAQVVDAGGRGFEVLITAVHAFLTGETIDVAIDVGAELSGTAAAGCYASDTYPYEVQYLLDAENTRVTALRQALAPHGDSLVVVAAGDLINVHIHTANVGAVIDVGVAFAAPQQVTITDLRAQIRQARPLDAAGSYVTHPMRFVGVIRHHALRHLIGDPPGVHLVADDASTLPEQLATQKATLTLIGSDTADTAAILHQFAQQGERDSRRDALANCDSPLALLAAVSMFDAAGEPNQVLHDVQTVLNELVVATITAVDGAFVVHDTAGFHATGAFASTLGSWLTHAAIDTELVTVLFGDSSTLQQRSDINDILARVCPDAEQVTMDLPGADVVAWVGIE